MLIFNSKAVVELRGFRPKFSMIKAISDLQGFRGLILPIIVGALSATIGAVITVAAKILLIGNSP